MQAVIGVDPHKRVLSAVALDERGGVLGRWHGDTSRRGTRALVAWAAERAPGASWAIEGSNGLGRRLALALLEAGADVRDVCPTRTAERRRQRPGRGKSDAVDAEAIARELQAHPRLPRAFKAAAVAAPDPAREELAVLVRARQQLVDRHRRLLNEAEALLRELPADLAERLPDGSKVEPRLTAAARLRRTGVRLTDLRLELLRAKAREERALAAECARLERRMAQLLRQLGTSLLALLGLGTLGAAELLVEVGDPRRFPSADAFASYTGTAPIPASSAEVGGRPAHHRLSRFGNRRLNAVLYRMALARLRSDAETQAYVARLLGAGKTRRDALRILKRRLARLVWRTMIRDLAPGPAEHAEMPSPPEGAAGGAGAPGRSTPSSAWMGDGSPRGPSALLPIGGGASPAGAERSGAAERSEA